jgi:hypothetical protein
MALTACLIAPSLTGAAGTILLRPRLMTSPAWRATVTPLASIIGSGFLVAGPVLAHVAGRWAVLAMLGLCAVAYLFGAAIRFNIRVVEPILENGGHRRLRLLDEAADLALVLAYFVSVAYYLNLFAAFGLRMFGVVDDGATRLLASAVIAMLGLLGAFRGLGALEWIETVAVGVKLSIIAGLVAMLAWAAVWLGGSAEPLAPPASGAQAVSVLLGLVILVQGFETSRYFGAHYSAGFASAPCDGRNGFRPASTLCSCCWQHLTSPAACLRREARPRSSTCWHLWASWLLR